MSRGLASVTRRVRSARSLAPRFNARSVPPRRCGTSTTAAYIQVGHCLSIVSFGDAPCKISSITSTEVQCQIGTATKVWYVDNSGIHPGGSLFAAGYRRWRLCREKQFQKS